MRRAAKRDANEAAIIEALEAVGWLVVRLSGPGLPDLMCHRDGETRFVEVKSRSGKMEPAQVDLHFAWAKAGVAIYIARTSFEGCYGNVNFRHIAWAGVSTSEKRRRLATEDS